MRETRDIGEKGASYYAYMYTIVHVQYMYNCKYLHSGAYSVHIETIFLLISANVYYIYAMHIAIHAMRIQSSYFLIAHHLQAVAVFRDTFTPRCVL